MPCRWWPRRSIPLRQAAYHRDALLCQTLHACSVLATPPVEARLSLSTCVAAEPIMSPGGFCRVSPPPFKFSANGGRLSAGVCHVRRREKLCGHSLRELAKKITDGGPLREARRHVSCCQIALHAAGHGRPQRLVDPHLQRT